MVQRGQFLERPTLIPVGEVVMEGMAHRGASAPPLLVIPPQPEHGSGMDHVVAAELVWAAARAGHATLRFNHRGVGGSQGEQGRGGALVEDAEAALSLASENAANHPVVVAAIGSGAATALALVDRGRPLAGLVLINPGVLSPESIGALAAPLQIILAEEASRALRSAWSQAAQQAGGTLEIIPGADARFQKYLPEVGRLVAQFLSSVSSL